MIGLAVTVLALLSLVCVEFIAIEYSKVPIRYVSVGDSADTNI